MKKQIFITLLVGYGAFRDRGQWQTNIVSALREDYTLDATDLFLFDSNSAHFHSTNVDQMSLEVLDLDFNKQTYIST